MRRDGIPDTYVTPGRWTVTITPCDFSSFAWRLADAEGRAKFFGGSASHPEQAEREARATAAQHEAKERHATTPEIVKVLT